MQRKLIQERVLDAQQVFLQKSHQIEQELQRLSLVAQQVMMDEGINNILASVREAPKNRKYTILSRSNQFIRNYASINPTIEEIAILTADDLVVSSRGVLLRNDFLQRKQMDWFKNMQERGLQTSVSPLYFPRTSNYQKEIITFVIRYTESEQHIKGYNYIMMDVEPQKLFSTIMSNSSRELLIVNADGDTILPSGQITVEQVTSISSKASEPKELEKFTVLTKHLPTANWFLYYPISKSELQQSVQGLITALLSLFTLIFTATLLLFSRIISRTIAPIHTIMEAMQKSHHGNFEVRTKVKSGDEIEILSNCYNKLIDDIKQYIEQLVEQEKRKKEIEFDLSTSQIHPHFIYNTLNLVTYLIYDEESEQAINVIYSLIDLLQNSVRIGNESAFSTIESELDLLESYLYITSLRYPHRFEVEREYDENLLDLRVPRIIIQPLVENAIIHGILPSSTPGIIKVKIFQEKNAVYITVEDNGVGISFRENSLPFSSNKRSTGVGIENIRNRMNFLYPNIQGQLVVTPQVQGGSLAKISIPLDFD